jgi:hypothetical protein
MENSMNPLAFFAMVGFVLLLGIGTTAYTFSKCDRYAFALAKAAGVSVMITGMCDKINGE